MTLTVIAAMWTPTIFFVGFYQDEERVLPQMKMMSSNSFSFVVKRPIESLSKKFPHVSVNQNEASLNPYAILVPNNRLCIAPLGRIVRAEKASVVH